ncbi:MAG: hypothetical protein QOJ11_319 [Frankiales bacterium]|jgi:hypothetical protein|nr:hypothetical protein [Frankiales bacterium]
MSQRLRRRLTTSLAVLATALSSAIGVGAMTATSASATSSVVYDGGSWAGDSWTIYGTDYCGGCGTNAIEQRFVAATSGPAAKIVLPTPWSQTAPTVEIRSAENFPSDGATVVATQVSSSVFDPGQQDSTTTFRMSGDMLTAGDTYVVVVRADANSYSQVGTNYTGYYYADSGFGYHYSQSWNAYGYYTLPVQVYESDGADPPTVSATVSPVDPDGANGWYKTAPAVHFACDDDLAVLDCPADYVVAAGGQDATSGTVHDDNGNTADWSLPAIKVDTIAPAVSIGLDQDAATAAGTYNASTNWYLGTPDFTGSCEDGATCTTVFEHTVQNCSMQQVWDWMSWTWHWQNVCSAPTTEVASGGNGYWLRTATDQAGNVATAQTATVNFNPDDPTITSTGVTGLNAAGWSNGGVTSGYDSTMTWRDDLPNTYINWSCYSQYAGVSVCGGPNNQTGVTDETPLAGADFTGTVTDNSGKTATATVNVKVDKTAPTIDPVITGTLGSSGWYTSPVTVSWTCADALSGVKSCSENTDTFTDHEGTASGTAVDVADNTTGASVDIKSDTVAPLITGTVLTDKGYGGVYDDPITVHWTCSEADSGNGVSGVADCPADTTVTGIGTDTVASATVLDNAGNATVGTVSHLFRRVNAPAITVTGAANGHTYAFGTTVTPSCTAVSGSGDTLDCTGTTEGGTADGSGLYVYTATATDPITHLSSVKTVQWIVSERAAVTLVIGDVTDGSDYAYGTAVHPSCTAIDADGHSVSCAGHVTGGDSDGSGLYTYRASATDSITGKTTAARVSWTVAARPAPQIAITGVEAGHVYPYGTKVSPACVAADAKGQAVTCDGVVSSHKLAGGGIGYLYKVTASDPVTGALSMASTSWTVAAQGKLAISGLPRQTHSGKPVLVVGKAYQVSVSFSGSTTSSAETAPYWLKPVKTNAAGTSGKPTTITGTFAPAAKGSYVWTFTPTKAMHGTFRKLGIRTVDGVVGYQTVYIK